MKSIFMFLFLLFLTRSYGQDANLAWFKNFGGTFLLDDPRSIVVDSFGNIYTMGNFTYTEDFDPDPAFTYTLRSYGEDFHQSRDIYITKFNSEGNFIWAKQLGGSGDDYGSSMAIDASGNVYTTGYFSDSADFDPNTAMTYTLKAADGYASFISKLDSAGNFVWATEFSGSSSSIPHVRSITVDAAGYVYTTETFGSILIRKLDPSGNFLFTRELVSDAACYSNSIIVDVLGNIYTTGYFYGKIDFNPDPGSNYELTADGVEAFVSKLNASGDFVWAKLLGGNYGNSITVDALGNIYTVGEFEDTQDFNPDPGQNYELISAGDRDVFISKLDASGNFVWAKRLGGNGADFGNSISVDADGNIYTIGEFSAIADFNPDPAGAYNFSTTGGGFDYDIFISKLNALGNFVWARQIGTPYRDYGNAIALNASRNIFITGSTPGGGAVFNATHIETNNGMSDATGDIFVGKLDQLNVLPISFSSITAFPIDQDVQVKWNVETESNIYMYEVEKSLNGASFKKARTMLPTRNDYSASAYLWLDTIPFKGNNFYRIKAVETSGAVKYSDIVSVNIKNGKSNIKVNPNPVVNKMLNLQLQNQLQSVYNVRLFNNVGQLVYSSKIKHLGGSSIKTIQLGNKIAAGIYQLQVNNDKVNVTQKIMIE